MAYATRTGMEQGRARGLEQGLEQGREQGLAQGRRQGESALLERLLARRFGPLPDATIQRLREASDVELEAWSANLLDAATLAKVFGE